LVTWLHPLEAPCPAPPKPSQPRRHAPRQAAKRCKATPPARTGPWWKTSGYWGRILGDVIREQEGAAAFELIERVRQLSVAYRLKADASAGRVLDRLLKNLSAEQTVTVIRAFSYFSHLANIAEDRHHVRRRAVHERARATCRKARWHWPSNACTRPTTAPPTSP
jgi:phosphoenolpyruvate carboxylase